MTGNPVRDDLLELDREARRPAARERFGLDPAVSTLLVFGGSQGARSLNRAIIEAHPHLGGSPLQILHIAGRSGYRHAAGAWEQARSSAPFPAFPNVKLVEFIEHMSDAYAAADAVVCRAGATSIAELTVLGIPAVLVPYPHATADHQTANARALERAGGAVVVDDHDLDGRRLADAVRPLLEDPATAARTARASRAFGRPDAAANVARLVLQLIDAGADT